MHTFFDFLLSADRVCRKMVKKFYSQKQYGRPTQDRYVETFESAKAQIIVHFTRRLCIIFMGFAVKKVKKVFSEKDENLSVFQTGLERCA